jgi:hypothetical protein
MYFRKSSVNRFRFELSPSRDYESIDEFHCIKQLVTFPAPQLINYCAATALYPCGVILFCGADFMSKNII